VAAVELADRQIRADAPQPGHVARHPLGRVPLLGASPTEQHRRQRRRRRTHVWRDVTAERDDARALRDVVGRGPEGHRDALREPEEHERSVRRQRGHLLAAHVPHHLSQIIDVVRDHQLAVLARHPARDDIAAARVEAMEALHRDDQPAIEARDAREVRREALGRLPVPVAANEQAEGRTLGCAHDVAAVSGGRDRVYGGSEGQGDHGPPEGGATRITVRGRPL
jgi:hypothetical protein